MISHWILLRMRNVWEKRCGQNENTHVMFSNITLNSVRQHNYFITQGNYIGYMFRLQISHLQAYFCRLSHKMLCTPWDLIVFTSMEYIKLNHLSQRVWRAICTSHPLITRGSRLSTRSRWELRSSGLLRSE